MEGNASDGDDGKLAPFDAIIRSEDFWWELSKDKQVKWRPSIGAVLREVQQRLCARCQRADLMKVLSGSSSSRHVNPSNNNSIQNCPLCALMGESTCDVYFNIKVRCGLGMAPNAQATRDFVFPAKHLSWSVKRDERLSHSWPANAEGVDFNAIREQLVKCTKAHPACQRGTTSLIKGLRVIDCETRQIVPAPTGCEFVALSYVWGSYTRRVPIKGKLPNEMYKSLEDSLSVVKALGLRYLWIDQYCIDQDDNSAEKMEQIEQMHLIYHHAQLVLIAAVGKDVTVGLPGVNGTPRLAERVSHVTEKSCFVTSSSEPWSLIHTSDWSTRGWTFQEAFFARRRVVFTPEKVILECREECFSEGDTAVQKTSFSVLDIPFYDNMHQPSFDEIASTIEVYSRRQLSFESDILKALHGMLNAWKAVGVYHLWGVPELAVLGGIRSATDCSLTSHPVSGLARGLLWTLLWEGGRRREGFPSWSWAGWKDEFSILTEPGISCKKGTRIYVELENGQKLSWHAYRTLDHGINLSSPASRFIHLHVQCVPMEIRVSRNSTEKAESEGSYKLLITSPGYGNGENLGTLWNVRVYTIGKTVSDEQLQYMCTAGPYMMVLLGFPQSRRAHVDLLVVEHKGDCYERVGHAMPRQEVVRALPWEWNSLRLG